MHSNAIVNSFEDAVIALDFEGRIISANNSAAKTLRINSEALTGKKLSDVVPKSCQELEIEIIRRLNQGFKVPAYQTVCLVEDGSQSYFNVNILPLNDDYGTQIGYLRIAKDIGQSFGDIKSDALNQRLASHLTNTPLAVIEWSKELEVIYWSENAEKLFGHSAKKVVGKKVSEINLIYEEDLNLVNQAVIKMLEGNSQNFFVSNRNKHKDGEILHCDWHNSVLCDPDGNVASILSLVLDKTEQKKNEIKLRNSELSLNEAQRLSNIGHWEWDPEDGQIVNSEQLLVILGLNHVLKTDDVPKLFGPKEWRRIYPSVYDLFVKDRPFNLECQYVHPDGKIRHLKARASKRKLSKSKFIFHGTIQDITERKQTELEIIQEKSKLEILLEGTPDAIVLVDSNFKLVLFNQHAQDNFKWLFPGKELSRGVSLTELINDNHADWLKKIYQVLPFNETKQFEIDLPTSRGTQTYWQLTVYPIYGRGNVIQNICFRFLNIDVLKKATLEREFELNTRNALINNSTDLIWSIDREYRLIAANQAYAQRYLESCGIEMQLGNRVLNDNLFEEEILGLWKSNYLKAFQGEAFIHVSSFRAERDTQEQYNETSFNPIREGNEIVGVACQSRNITQRLAQERALERASYLLKQSQQVARIGNWVLYFESSEQKIVCSDVTLNILGLNAVPDNGLLPDYFKFAHPEDQATLMQKLTYSFANSSPIKANFRIIHEDKPTIWVEINAEISYDDTSQERYMIGVVQDVTARHEIQQRIENLNQELEQKVKERTIELKKVNDELESFSYSVSHDLRAPLRAIHGYASILHEQISSHQNQETDRLLNNIQSNAKQMGTLIDDLLDFARIGKKELQVSTINMNELVEQIVLEINAGSKHNTRLRIAPLQNIHADASMISRVWANLISNAIKYSRKKEDPEVCIECSENDGYVTYIVRDNGAGFDMAYYNKLFGVFQRLHSPKDFEGTGVGLAIVEKIVAKHGGRIWAESELDKGATFYFSLPKSKLL